MRAAVAGTALLLPLLAWADGTAEDDHDRVAVPPASPWRALLEGGVARDSSSLRIGVQYDFAPQWRLSRSLALYSSLDLAVGYWRVNKGDRQGISGVSEVGLTPSLRLGGPSRTGLFAEIGVGATSISPRYESTRAHFSTNYQFGDHFGVGWRSSSRAAWEIGLRYEHFSNAGIKHPNPGIGFSQLRLSAAF